MPALQIRNIPDDLHRRMKARAAMAGQSLSEFALIELRRSLEKPSRAELIERVRARGPVTVSQTPAELVRAERDAR